MTSIGYNSCFMLHFCLLINISSGSFLLNILNIPQDIKSILELYRHSRENGVRVIPEAENATSIVPGLPGTHFQKVLEQNIGDICFSIFQCNASERYRTMNGSCNNLVFPMWGLTGSALLRLLPANYEDGLHQPRLSMSGKPLPNPRQLRNILLPIRDMPDHINTRIVMEWGQIISHDTSHISVLPAGNLDGLECCINNQYPIVSELPAQCMPIQVPKDDPYFGEFNQTCLNFVRAITTTDYGCSLVPQQQLGMVTHFVDASWVYGSTNIIANRLRERQGGRLIVSRTPDGREFPPSIMNATHYCEVFYNNDTCYYGGDIRINQNTDVTVMHVLFLREHNKLCRELSAINPHWDDERLYQEARRIVIASVQRITYSDFLIVMLGVVLVLAKAKKGPVNWHPRLCDLTPLDYFLWGYVISLACADNPESIDTLEMFKNVYTTNCLDFYCRNYSSRNGILDYDFNQLYDGYEHFMNPTSVNEFTVTAYRAFHCLIPSTMELTKENGCPFRSLLLSDWYFRPSILEEPGTFDGLVRGLATQSANRFTNQFSPQVADKLFRAESPFGSDLASIDIQRNRDHGIPPYNSFRVACGRPRANNFSDFRDVMSEQDITLLSQHYEHIDDVEFYIAGLMERPAEGALTGPTFQCILGEQFVRWRNGDRFYYQFRNQSGSFTPDQFKQLEKLRLSLVFCRNGDRIQNIQPNVFQRPSTMNQVVPCSELPQLNLEPWRER